MFTSRMNEKEKESMRESKVLRQNNNFAIIGFKKKNRNHILYNLAEFRVTFCSSKFICFKICYFFLKFIIRILIPLSHYVNIIYL